MFHTQINGTIIVFSEKIFEAHIDSRGTVPLRQTSAYYLAHNYLELGKPASVPDGDSNPGSAM